MAYPILGNAILRDIAHNIRSDHSIPLGKAKRLLDGLYEADAALTYRQQQQVQEAAQANDRTDHAADARMLRELVAQLRKDLDAARKQLAAERVIKLPKPSK